MKPMWIGGRPVTTQRTLTVTSPFSGETVGEAPWGTAEHAWEAVEVAQKGARAMRDLPAHRRADILTETARLLLDRKAEFARTLALEVGKTLKEATAEVDRAALIFTFAADEARRLHGEQIPFDSQPTTAGRIGLFVREPVGIVGAITPFNVPLALAAHKLAPAIAAGNALVWKPAEQTPLNGLMLGETLYDAGLPPEALSVLTGDGPEVGQPIVEAPEVGFISFTGSREVGHKLARLAGPKKISLELGNNGALVITESADLDRAADAVVKGAFGLAGQLCISIQRLYLHRAVFKPFLDRLVPLTEALKVGDPLDPGADVGPVIDREALRRIERWVSEAIASGAKALTGGRAEGPCYLPTILTGVPRDSRLQCDEAFAPLVIAEPYDTLDEAIERVNSTPYGLQMAIFTDLLSEGWRFAREVRAGGVMINDPPGLRNDMMPYGGAKESGLGREGVRWAMEAMTTPKVISFNP